MSARRALQEAETVLCSACLLGWPCRWDGTHKRTPAVERALAGKAIVLICPEVAGGLPVPRPPADFAPAPPAQGPDGATAPQADNPGRAALDRAADLVDAQGRAVTQAFLQGASEACEAVRRFGAQAALLKEGSPSCGVHRVRWRGAPVPGMGVAAAALDRAGVRVISDEDLAD